MDMLNHLTSTGFRAYEEYVLKDRNVEEGLKNLVEGSDSYKYLRCIDLLTKKGAKLSTSEKAFIEDYIEKKETDAQRQIAMRWCLTQYDAGTSEEEKAAALDRLKDAHLRIYLGHQRPSDLYVKPSEQVKVAGILSDSKGLFDEVDLKLEFQLLYDNKTSPGSFDRNALVKTDLEKLTRGHFFELLRLMGEDILMLDSNKKFYDVFADWIKKDFKKSRNYEISKDILNTMTIEQMDKLKAKVPDIANDPTFVSFYFNKKFSSELSDEENLHLTNKEKRDNLIKMYEYAKPLPHNLSGLRSSLLLEILEYGLKLNIFDKNYFTEYLKLPARENFLKKKAAGGISLWNKCIENVQVEHNRGSDHNSKRDKDKELFTKYLQHFFLKGSEIGDFTDYLDKEFLVEVLENTMLTTGKKVEFTKENTVRLELLATTVEITIGVQNKDVFEIGEDVSLGVELKNVPKLFIKVFEINTENYYRKHLAPFKTDINLDGLIASIERTVEFAQPPHLRFQETLNFPQLKGKVGLYVIELIGNGKSSRAVVKIGTLSLVTRNTVAGQLCYVLDGKRKVCCKHSTAIWMAGQHFKADLEDNGKIIVPYLPSGGTKKETAILLHEGLAQLVDIMRTEEVYSLKCGFYLLTESVIMGEKGTILIRPQLFVNDRIAELSLLKNIKCILYTTDYIDGIPATKTYPGLKLAEDKELIVEFQAGANMSEMRIEFVAEVQNVTKDKTQTLTAEHRFEFVTRINENSIAELHLRLNVQSDYELYVLGKNGEPIPNTAVSFSIRAKSLRHATNVCGTTNEQGLIKVGKLKDVIEITATLSQSAGKSNISRTWKIPARNVMQYPKFIDVLEDEVIELPVARECANEMLFLRGVDKELTLYNVSDKVKVTSDKNLLYSVATIRDLKMGIYLLTGLENERIRIRVHKGSYWPENPRYILKKYSLLENSEKQGFIKIKSVELTSDKGRSSHLKLQIEGATKDQWRVHVMLFRFVPPNLDQLTLRLLARDQFAGTEYFFQKWKNFYMSNRELSSEFRYCFDRIYQQSYTGNMLDKPKLLLKRNFIKNTYAQEEVYAEGTKYDYASESQAAIPTERYDTLSQVPAQIPTFGHQERYHGLTQANYVLPAAQRYQSAGQERYRGINIRKSDRLLEGSSGSAAPVDKIYSHQDFLGVKPLTLCNFPATPDGSIVIELSEECRDNYACMLILAVDKGSVAHYLCPLPGSNLPKHDRCLKKTLDANKMYSEMRTAKCISKYDTHIIEDMASTKFQIVDSLEKVYLIIKELIRLYSRSVTDLQKFEQLLKWDTLTEGEKNKVLSKYTSHELHLFVYKKDPEYFNKVVKPYLQCKMEKTFMDYYLLGKKEEVFKVADSLPLFSELNQLEKALLVEVLAKEGRKEMALAIAQRLRNSFTFRKPTVTEVNKVFDTVLSLGSLKTSKKGVHKMVEEEKKVATIGANSLGASASDDEQMSQIMCQQMPKQLEMFRNLQPNTGGTARYHSRRTARPLEELGETKEYAETHYYRNTSVREWKNAVTESEFWADYAEFHAAVQSPSTGKPFLTRHFTSNYSKLTDVVGALALLDLPYRADEHGYRTIEGRNLELKAANNLVIFQKEIKESEGDIRNSILVAQQYVDIEHQDDRENDIEEFLTNHIYISRTIITNVSPNKLEFDVLLQIPEGALPIGKSPYQKSYSLSLDGYTTSPSKLEHKFYFPQPGKFVHFPANVSINSVVVAKASAKTLTVLKERTKISETNFRDVVSTGKTDLILNFIREKPIDTIKGFRWDDVYWLLRDYGFYEQLIKILKQQRIFDSVVWSYSMYHKKSEELMAEYLDSLNHAKVRLGFYFDSTLMKARPVDSGIQHLDYYPLVNPRAHKNLVSGSANNQQPLILNNDLYITYKKLILYLIEKPEWDFADRMNLIYYLLLQDKVAEALKIFKKIDPAVEIAKEERLKIQYDYMAAYLDFYLGVPDFKVARKIVAEYLNYPVITWQLMFLDMDQQLKDYDGINVDEDEEAETKEMVKLKQIKAEPMLSIELEGKTVVVNYNNIAEIAVKYYVINLEMLFSHTPFLTQNADDFSYVKPNKSELVKLDLKGKQCVVNIPEQYSKQNILIEVNSGAIQHLVTYFSTSLKLQIFENYGELRVTDENDQQLPQVYVKVFIKNHDGRVGFYKDGYTDIRGRFDYASVNASKIKAVQRFAIFVMNEKYGSMIKECQPPVATKGKEETMEPVKTRLASYYKKNQAVWGK